MEPLAAGRTAEVFAWGEGRVLRLDRPEWNGLAVMEAAALAAVTAAGAPAPVLFETVVVDGRQGVVLQRVDGPILWDVIAGAADIEVLARRWNEMHCALNDHVVAGVSDLVAGVGDGIRRSGLDATLVEELVGLLGALDDGRRVLCHFDLHPGNVIVGPDGWVIIDWMTASSGPPDADFARTLLLDPPGATAQHGRFMAVVAREGMKSRAIDRARLDEWIRVVAAARLAEGFDGEHAAFLIALASGDRHLEL